MTRPETFSNKVQNFSAKGLENSEIKNLPSEKILLSKRFSEEVECRFDNPAGSFSANGRKIFTQIPKLNLKK